MKVNLKIFNQLTREPSIKQHVKDKEYNIFFANKEEKETILKNDITSVLSTDGKEYRLLLDEEAYNYKINKEYYSENINALRVDLIERADRLQKISLFAITLPISVMLIIVVTLVLIFNKKWFTKPNESMWLIAALMVLVFSVSMTVNKFVKNKMVKYHDEMEKNIEKELGPDLVNELSKSIEEFNLEKNQKAQQSLDKPKEEKKEENPTTSDNSKKK